MKIACLYNYSFLNCNKKNVPIIYLLKQWIMLTITKLVKKYNDSNELRHRNMISLDE